MDSQRLQGHAAILTVNIFFGLNMPVAKSILGSDVSPELFTLLRVAAAGVFFWGLSLFLPKEPIAKKDFWMLLFCALTGIALNQGLFIFGLSRTSPLDAGVIVTLTPIFVLILAALILKDPITRLKIAGVALGMGGALMLVLSAAGRGQTGAPSGNAWGDLIIAASGVAYALYFVFGKDLALRYTPVTMLKWMMLFSTIMMLPVLWSKAFAPGAFDWVDSPSVWARVGYLIAFGTIAVYLLIPFALKRMRPTTMSMYNYVQPIVACAVAIAIGQDSATISKFVAAALVFAGVALVTSSKRAPAAPAKPRSR